MIKGGWNERWVGCRGEWVNEPHQTTQEPKNRRKTPGTTNRVEKSTGDPKTKIRRTGWKK